MLLLELFSGTGSVGRVARRNGYDRVISVDIDESRDPDYACDVRQLPYRELPTPDFIWASPPCTTYSFAAIWYGHRDGRGRARTEDAHDADAILRCTFRIIRYFLRRNPRLGFCIENPRGYMRQAPETSGTLLTTTSYNHFGYPICKPTDLFTNYPLALPACARRETDLRICGSNAAEIRRRMNVRSKDSLTTVLYRIPPRLVGLILRQARAAPHRRNSRRRASRSRNGCRSHNGSRSRRKDSRRRRDRSSRRR